jgi:hypothetical protein
MEFYSPDIEIESLAPVIGTDIPRIRKTLQQYQ